MIDRPERDAHVDRLLREAMTGPVRAETADCLDVETLAAWSEGNLRAGERTRAEAHAATCTRCQSMLAAMVRTEPVLAAVQPSPFRKWLTILGPAAGAAAAVALWFAVDRPPRDTTPQIQTMARVEHPESSDADKNSEEKARAVPSEPVAAPVAAPKEKETEQQRSREADKLVGDERRLQKKDAPTTLDRLADAPAKPEAAPAKPAGALAESVVVSAAPPATPPPPPASPSLPFGGVGGVRSDQTQAAQAATQAQGQTQTQNANQLPSPFVNQAQINQAAPAARRANETAPASARIAGARDAAQDAALSAREGFAARQEASSTFEVQTPDASIRYRVVDGRTVQRTTDGGKAWTTGHIVLTATTLAAGSAPAPTVCWLAGSSGLVLMTADGLTWREVKLPEPAAIKAISASNAQTATVTLADGRILTTTNGGVSWNRPQ